ncbi:ATP-binding protein [Candidatus Micrarchaeota archaeon]|nr:ATP-binding protein [Candidatus Micrarchaeota archaeon]
MDERLFSLLVVNSEEKKKEAHAHERKRYVYEKLRNAPKGYFVGVCGLRGIGKTVLLLQLANEFKDSLYLSADASYLRGESLYGVIRFAAAKGHKTIFVDEVHCASNWQQDLKTIYDEGVARVFFSGSTALEIRKGADLSRRALVFHLQPLSFREYLSIKKGLGEVQPVTASELFDAGKRKARVVETSKYAGFLHEYFNVGGLLYPSDDTAYYYKALESTLEKIIHNDLEHLRAMDSRIENVVYKVLEWIASSPVGEVNYSTLSSKVSVSKPTLISVVNDLAKIGLVKRVLPCGKSSVRKEPKLFLAFPFREFLNSLFLKKSDAGSLREEFFVNHAGSVCYLKGKRGEKTADFLFEGKALEIGGAGKSFHQNPDFIVKEEISFEEKMIPLYLTGFLY